MKKILRIVSMTVLLLFCFSMTAFADPPPWAGGNSKNKEVKEHFKLLRKQFKGTVRLNGKQIKFDVAPYELGGRVMIPLRAMAATLKAEVTYKTDGTKQVITVEKNNKLVVMTMDSNKGTFSITVNGKKVEADSYPELRGGRTFVPLRLLAVLLGLKVDYNGDIDLRDDKDKEADLLDKQKKAKGIAYGWYDFSKKSFETDARAVKGKLNKEKTFKSLDFAVVNTEDDLDNMPDYDRKIPRVDYNFDRYLYIWGLGKANTGGYNLFIDEISQLEKVVWVKVHLVSPAKGAGVTQAITYPYDLIRIRRSDFLEDGRLTFIFLDQNNNELAKIKKTI